MKPKSLDLRSKIRGGNFLREILQLTQIFGNVRVSRAETQTLILVEVIKFSDVIIPLILCMTKLDCCQGLSQVTGLLHFIANQLTVLTKSGPSS